MGYPEPEEAVAVYRVVVSNIGVGDLVVLNETGEGFLEIYRKEKSVFPVPNREYLVKSIVGCNGKNKKRIGLPFAVQLQERVNGDGELSWEDYDDGRPYNVRFFRVVGHLDEPQPQPQSQPKR